MDRRFSMIVPRVALSALGLAVAVLAADGPGGTAPLAAQQKGFDVERAGIPGWLGVQYTVERTFDWGGRSAVSSDYIVSDVHPDGPAAAAGIRAGDVLIGIRGAGPGDTLFERIAETLLSGDTVRLRLRRGGAQLDLPVVAVARPAPERLGLASSPVLAGAQGVLRLERRSEEESGGMTIVFRSGSGSGFSYRMITPEPGTSFPFESFVVRTPATDSLTSLINLMRRSLTGIERESEVARVAVMRATNSASLDEQAMKLADLSQRRGRTMSQITRLQDELALASRQLLGPRFGTLSGQLGDVRVRVSPQAPWTPLVRLERRYLLGAEIISIDSELGGYFGVDRGVLVAASPEGTPAAAAGLAAGDVIVRVGDIDVADPAGLSRALRAVRGPITLTVVRRGSELKLELR